MNIYENIVVSDLTLKRFSISVSSSCFVLTSIKIEGLLWLFFSPTQHKVTDKADIRL